MSYYPHVDHILERASVKRAQEAMDRLNVSGRIHALSESARTAQEAADSLGVEVGQIASSLIFKLPSGGALLIITSGRHRVDTDLVAKNLGVEKLSRVDADFVKEISGYSIGGVSPLGWVSQPETTLIDEALNVMVVPPQTDEFTCSECFIVKHKSMLAKKKGKYGEVCVECS